MDIESCKKTWMNPWIFLGFMMFFWNGKSQSFLYLFVWSLMIATYWNLPGAKPSRRVDRLKVFCSFWWKTHWKCRLQWIIDWKSTVSRCIPYWKWGIDGQSCQFTEDKGLYPCFGKKTQSKFKLWIKTMKKTTRFLALWIVIVELWGVL